MIKRELLEKIADLPDEAEVLLAIITPKDETESFVMGADGGDSDDDEDDDTIDNEDGTVTNLEGIDDVQILENEDPETGAKEKFAAIVIDMCDEEDDEEGEDGDATEEVPPRG